MYQSVSSRGEVFIVFVYSAHVWPKLAIDICLTNEFLHGELRSMQLQRQTHIEIVLVHIKRL